MKQPLLKRQVIFDLALSWVIFMGLIVNLAIEASCDYGWTMITNAIWVVGMIALAFFMGRGFYRLAKYIREKGE